MAAFKMVIFDCDGVLVDSEVIANRVEQKVYKGLGYDIDEVQFNERFAGMTNGEIKFAIEDELGYDLPDSLLDEIKVQIDSELKEHVTMIEGADAMIRAVDRPKCICSNSTNERLNITLTKTGLLPLFPGNLFSGQDIVGVQPKPAPDIFLHAMKKYGVEPHETIILEDSIHGVNGGVAAGARVVGFTGASHSWPSHADMLTEAGAETVISRLAEFPAVMQALESWDGI